MISRDYQNNWTDDGRRSPFVAAKCACASSNLFAFDKEFKAFERPNGQKNLKNRRTAEEGKRKMFFPLRVRFSRSRAKTVIAY